MYQLADKRRNYRQRSNAAFLVRAGYAYDIVVLMSVGVYMPHKKETKQASVARFVSFSLSSRSETMRLAPVAPHKQPCSDPAADRSRNEQGAHGYVGREARA